ncbi:MAG: ECF transporter S component [Anaeroplasmataceae bacterium]|nr:ECF transporter S component [Anaeroplasmataceae bacterium]
MKKNSIFTVKRLCFIGIFAALSILFYTVIPKIKLPFFPPFLELNFSMIPIIICAFMLGPIDGSICVLMRFLVKLPMSSTSCVGETADLLIGLPVAIVVGIFYNHTHFKYKELWAFLSAFVLWILMGVFTNAFINIPFYSTVFGGMEPIIGACSDAFKMISGGKVQSLTKENFMFYYLFLAVIPFNSLIAAIVLFITWPVHKRLKFLYNQIGGSKETQDLE